MNEDGIADGYDETDVEGAPNGDTVFELVDEVAAVANGVDKLPAPTPKEGALGVSVVDEAGVKLKVLLANVGSVVADVKLLGIEKALVDEDIGEVTPVVLMVGSDAIGIEPKKFTADEVLVLNDGIAVV